MTPEDMVVWNKISDHPAVCSCTDCERWLEIERVLTERAEEASKMVSRVEPGGTLHIDLECG